MAEVTPLPIRIEASEPGGVNCTTRKSGPFGKSMSSRKSELLVETFRSVDVGDRDDHDFELHVHEMPP